jgi:hypothetical protein
MRTVRLILFMLAGAVIAPVVQGSLDGLLWQYRSDGPYPPEELAPLTWALIGAVGGLIAELVLRIKTHEPPSDPPA